MFNLTKKSLTWGDKELVLETGKIARQADGAVIVTYGEPKLLCTVVAYVPFHNFNTKFF